MKYILAAALLAALALYALDDSALENCTSQGYTLNECTTKLGY